jgi:hypothetical protein
MLVWDELHPFAVPPARMEKDPRIITETMRIRNNTDPKRSSAGRVRFRDLEHVGPTLAGIAAKVGAPHPRDAGSPADRGDDRLPATSERVGPFDDPDRDVRRELDRA